TDNEELFLKDIGKESHICTSPVSMYSTHLYVQCPSPWTVAISMDSARLHGQCLSPWMVPVLLQLDSQPLSL
ncbi:hypothetical protein HispidOSU_006469, partial [Sigmodon hispidus]